MELFKIDAGLTFWALVTFACLFLLLARYAFRPLQQVLKEREEKITGSVQAAERARDEAGQLLEKNRQQLDEAREEARRIINEGHRIVTTMKQEVKEISKKEAAQIIESARAEIDRELQRSLEELKGTVAGLSVRISRQIIKEELDEKRHQELANEFIDRLKKRQTRRAN